ncbi:MAG: FAD-dependent oxidoreductase [Janthinobacterium lividum]
MSTTQQAFDVIVIGAGMAGHCTALEAARQGGAVLLLEKTARYGGSTRMCGGAFAFAGTAAQQKSGVQDTAEILEEDLMKAGKYRNDRALVHIYASEQYGAYKWLEAMGLTFDKVSLSGAQSVPRNHSINPVRVLETLHSEALKAGVTFRENAGVERLLTEGAAGDRVVTGVVLSNGEKILARGGVVIATGGFSRATDLVERFVPHLLAAKPMGGEGNTGDGLRMAWALGADLIDIGYVKGTFGAPVRTPIPGTEEIAPRIVSSMYRGAIVVNAAGKRFVKESVSYKVIGDYCLQQPNALAFQVFDSQVMAQSSPLPTVADYESALKSGLLVQADTLDELAEKVGIDVAALRATVTHYNAAVDGKEADEFERDSLSTGYGKPTRVEQAPFYALPCTTGLTSTYCGLRVNEQAHVLDVYKESIPGLYATGEVMGGFHGETYMSGSSLAKGCIFGRIAATDALVRAGVRPQGSKPLNPAGSSTAHAA